MPNQTNTHPNTFHQMLEHLAVGSRPFLPSSIRTLHALPHLLPSLPLQRCHSNQHLNQLQSHLVICGILPAADALAISRLLAFFAGGDLRFARHLFDQIPNPNKFVYNTLIRAYSNSHCPQEALFLHRRMLRHGLSPNEFALPFVLKACVRAVASRHMMAVHGLVVRLGFESQVFVVNALLHAYASCGSVHHARKLFDEMPERNVVSWNSMIGGYSHSGEIGEAFALFRMMRRWGLVADEFTLVSLLYACSLEGNLELGQNLHGYIVVSAAKVDLILGSALVDMYGKCGDLEMACRCFYAMPGKNVVSWTSMLCAHAKHGSIDAARDWFEQMPERNIVSWNAMISCYVQDGLYLEALHLYDQMQAVGVAPDEVTLVAVISACSQNGDLVTGKRVHHYVIDNFEKPSITLVNSLLDMYAKCGPIDVAMSLFSEMPIKNVVSWNVVIGALAMHGCANAAIEFFKHMVSAGFSPDGITFVGLLSACSHGGLLEAGQYYFESMSCVYNVMREVEHYACMVDLLGRRGHLEKAVELIKSMPMKPDVVIWGALLGACRIHRNVKIGKQVIKQLLELERVSGGLFVLISNMLYETHQQEDMTKLRKLMKERGMRKEMGTSSIEINGLLHEFGVEDIRHERSTVIYAVVDQLSFHLMPLHVQPFQSEEILVVEE